MKSMSILRTSPISVPPPHRPVCEARRPAGAVAGQQAVDMLTLLRLVRVDWGARGHSVIPGATGPRAPGHAGGDARPVWRSQRASKPLTTNTDEGTPGGTAPPNPAWRGRPR